MHWLKWMSILMLLEILEAMETVLAHDLDVNYVIPQGFHFLHNVSGPHR